MSHPHDFDELLATAAAQQQLLDELCAGGNALQAPGPRA